MYRPMTSASTFCRWFAALFGGALVLLVAAQLWRDPLGVWGPGGKAVDSHMRLAKSLQLLTRPSGLVVIGSSRVYRGFDVGGGYNLGISSLRIAEMEEFVDYLLAHRQVGQLVIGLDYFMFDHGHMSEPGFDATMMRRAYVPEAWLGYALSYEGVRGLWEASDAAWHGNGFKVTPEMSAAQLPQVIGALPDDLTRVQVTDAELQSFARMLGKVKRSGVKVAVYVSPMHQVQFELLEHGGALSRFDEWRGTIASLAQERGVVFFDLAHAPFSDEPELLAQGHSEHWLDPTHFKPEVGQWILERVLQP